MNKKLMKVITLILSCLLLVGAAVGVTAFAADSEPEAAKIEIAKKNIAYEGAIQMLYLVDANDAAKALGSVKVVFGADVEVGSDVTGLTVKGDAGDFTLEGKTYDTVYSNGIVAKEYRKELKATPVIVNADNKVEVVGTPAVYNPFDYAMTRFDGTYNDAQYNLYKSLLDYSAAVQTVLGYTDETVLTLGGWADEYYRITLDNVTENYRGAEFDGTLTAERFNGEEGFKGWTDGNGNAVEGWTTLTVKPGTRVLKTNYGPVNIINDGTSTAGATVTGNGGDNAFLNAANGVISFGKTDGNFINSAVRFAPSNPGVYAEKYIFEADFNLDSWNMSKDNWMAKFAMWAEGSGNNGEMFNATLSGANGGDSAQVNGVHFELKTWNHIKMVAEVVADGTVYVHTYVNGVKVAAGYQAAINKYGNYKMINAGLQFRDGGSGEQDCTQATILFDNVEVYTEGTAASYDIGLDTDGDGTADDTYRVTMGEVPAIPTPTHPSGYTFVAWYLGDAEYDTSTAWNYLGAGKDADDNTVYGKAPTLTAFWATPAQVTFEVNGGNLGTYDPIVNGQPYELPIPTNGDLIFSGWLDDKGNIIPSKGSEWTYGDIALTAKWYVESANQSYANYTGGGSKNFNVPGYSDSAVDEAGKMYVFKTTYTFEGVTGCFTGTGAAGDAFQKAYSVAPIYVKLQQGTSDGTNLWATPASAGGAIYTKNAEGKFVPTNDGLLPEGCTGAYLSTLSWGGVTYQIGEEYDIEWTILMNGEGEAPTSVFTATKKSDGSVQTGNMTLSYKASINQFRWELRSAQSATGNANNTFTTSNTFNNTSWSVRVPAVSVNVTLDAQGGTFEGEANRVFVGGTDYTLPTPSYEGLTFGGWYNGETPVGNSGKWSIAEDVTLTAKWMAEVTGVYNDFNNGTKTGIGFGSVEGGKLVSTSLTPWSGSTYFAVNSAATLVTGNAAGTKYIFETDFTYTSGANGSEKLPAFFGFANAVSTSNSRCYLNDYVYASSTQDAAGDGEYVTMYGQKHYKNVTYKIRYEYVVGETDIHVYVDGDYKGAYSTKFNYPTDPNDTTKVNDPSSVYGFVFYCRDGSFGATFDNTYCGVQAEATKVNYTLDATHGNLPEGTSAEGSAMTGSVSNLPTPTAEGLEFLGWYVGNEAAVVNGLISDAVTDGATLTAKYATVTNHAGTNKPDWSASGWAAADLATPASASDAVGTKYVIKYTYTYNGISSFSVANGNVTRLTPDSSWFGYFRLYGNTGSNIVYASNIIPVTGSELVNAQGTVVADGDVLKTEYASLAATDIFYKQINMAGITYDFGKTYNIEISVEMDGSARPYFHLTATPVDGGAVQTQTLSPSADFAGFYKFRIEVRNGGASSFSIKQSFTNVSYDKAVAAPEHVASEVAAPEFIKNYATTTTANEYFKSCAVCGKIFADQTFFNGNPEVYQSGVAAVLPFGLTTPGSKLDAAPTTDANENGFGDGVYVTAETETVTNADGEEVVNTYLAYRDDNVKGGGAFKVTKADDVAAHKTVTFGFDMRFVYGADSRGPDQQVVLVKGPEGGNFKIDNDTNANYVTIFGVKFNKTEWHRIEYTLTWNETNANYDAKILIDGTVVKTFSNAFANGVIINWEIRYGEPRTDSDGDGTKDKDGLSDFHFDMDNFVYIAE